MHEDGRIENVNLTSIQFSDGGESVTLHLVGMVPPYKKSRLQCHNIYSLVWHRSLDLEAPYYVGELAWRQLADEEKHAALDKVRYSILDKNGNVLVPRNTMTAIHIDGAVCAEILTE